MRPSAYLCVVLLLAGTLLAGCSALGNGIQVKDDGRDIISIDRDGFRLEGNFTGVTLDKNGLEISYPNGDITVDGDGLNIKQGDSTISVNGDRIEIVDSDGKKHVLDTAGAGVEYKSDSGAVVATGGKAVMPPDYPTDLLPLMDGFTLASSADLGKVDVVSGFVKDASVQDVEDFYQPILLKGKSFHQERRAGMVLLRANLEEQDVTVYIYDSLKKDTANYSVVVGED